MKKETIALGSKFLAELLQDPAIMEALAPIFARIGAKIAEQTAAQITSRHMGALIQPKDTLLPVSDACSMLKISAPTFRRRFIQTGLLKLIEAPENGDKRMKYVSAKAFGKLYQATPMAVVRLKAA